MRRILACITAAAVLMVITAGCGGGGGGSGSGGNTTDVTLNKTTATVATNNSVVFTSNRTVTWSVIESGGGTVSPTSGFSTTYTAPSTAGTYHIQATNAANTTDYAQATITVKAITTTITITASTKTVIAGGNVTLTANKSVKWGVLESSGGSVSPATGTTTTYTAPSTAGTYHIRATNSSSSSDYTQVSIKVVTTSDDVTISPESANLAPSGTKQFTANIDVTWTVTEGSVGGTITSSGFYTAPAASGTYHVVATSKVDSSKKATVTVVVDPLLPPDAPTGVAR